MSISNFLSRNKSAGISSWLVVSCAVSISLLAYRQFSTGSPTFTFLVWNLFLAAIPLAISSLTRYTKPTKAAMLLLLPTWLLFFPNAPYLLTDLMHLRYLRGMPLWFDLTMILSFALNGLVFGYLSLLQIENWLAERTNKTTAFAFSFFALGAAAFGIYLGRFLRWNSWDIIHHPISLLADIFDRFRHPFEHLHTFGFTITLFAVLLCLYGMLKAVRLYAAK